MTTVPLHLPTFLSFILCIRYHGGHTELCPTVRACPWIRTRVVRLGGTGPLRTSDAADAGWTFHSQHVSTQFQILHLYIFHGI